MPKYLMIIVEDQSAYQNVEIATMNDVMQQHGDFAAAVEAAGAKMLGGEALQPTSTATYLRGTRSGNVTVVDNPAPDLKEVVGGYYLIEAKDGVISSLGLFETPEQADESSKLAAGWVRDEKLESAFPNPPKITSGKVLTHQNGVAVA